MPQIITNSAVYARLNDAVKRAGGTSAFARKIGASRQDVHAALNADRHPGPAILAGIGVRKVVEVRYELLDQPAAGEPVPEPGTCRCPIPKDRACMNPVCPRQPAQPREIPKPEAA